MPSDKTGKPTYYHLHLVTDATGETLVTMAKAASIQFHDVRPIEHVHPLVRNEQRLKQVINEIKSSPGPVLFTIIKQSLVNKLEAACADLGVPCLHVLSPIMDVFRTHIEASGLAPKLPEQGPGPHFTIRAGRIEFAPAHELDVAGNHVPTLMQLHPLLQEAASDLVAALGEGRHANIAHSNLHRLAKKYLDAIDQALDEVSFARLFGYGLRLQNAAAATARSILDRDLPELDDQQREALDSLLNLHGPFIIASAHGRELLEAADRYTRSPSEEQAFRTAAAELGRELQSRSDLANPDVATFIRETVEAAGSQEQPERNSTYGFATVKNVAVVVCAGGMIAIAASVATAGTVLAAVVGGVSGLAVIEGTKRSKAFKSLSEPITKGMDRLLQTDLKEVANLHQKSLRKMTEFVLQNEALFRRLAGTRRELDWINKYLDWIKAQNV